MSFNSKLAKKLAAKGEGGKKAAKVLIAIDVTIKEIWKYFKKVLWIAIVLLIFAGVFVGVSAYGKADFLKFSFGKLKAENVTDISLSESSEEESVDVEVTSELLSETESLSEEEETVIQNIQEEIQFDKSDWKLLLVNKEHPIPDDYNFELAKISGSMECDARILQPLNDMFAAAAEDGINLVVCSPYRESSRQEYLFDRKMKGYLNSGYSYIEAFKESSAVVTVPGSSEHQIGMALDIISDNYYKLDEHFGSTDAGIWLMQNAHKYGFIMRYPKGKDYITGIIYEPWHYRYVGVDAATVIYEKNITLEEFVESL